MKNNIFNIQWKKNYRKIPDFIWTELKSLSENEIIIACVKKISESDIKSGKYKHLDIKLKSDKPVFPTKITPNPNVGKYSRMNLEGLEVVRKDLPMITKTFVVEAPNYGDWSNGSHDVFWDRQIYVRDFIAPKYLEIDIELVGEESKEESLYIFKFKVNEVLDKNSPEFEANLFHDINLLQENVGRIGVYKSDAKLEDYLKTIYVDWEILPPGERDNNISKIISKFNITSDKDKGKCIERYDMLEKLKPKTIVVGASGFRRYIGAKLSDDLVVFENFDYGNAMYIMYEKWEELSKKSRIELLTGNNQGFDRIIHREGWESQLRVFIQAKLRNEI